MKAKNEKRPMYRIIKLSWFILLPLWLNGQNYLWPTNASNYLTSSFCEYRPGHYHSAIDIKTWNKEGYPCYAIEDGYIYRLRVSTVGYGKAFYLKLNDGKFAVYGHLQRFRPDIEKRVRQKQIENRKYTLNWYPEEKWFVKKGDIIGYSGQTGIGVPHLHFEIRDSLEHPLNPLLFYNKVKDTIAPVLQSLMIIPRNEQSMVNGSFLPLKLKLISKGNNQYVIKEPVYVNGGIGLALKGYDRANGVYNAFSFYKTELFIDSKKIFHLQYDWMDFKNTREVDLEIYYPERAATKKVYHQLFIEPVTTLQYYDRSLGDGIIKIENKKTPFKIVVSDFFGNTSTVNGILVRQQTSQNDFYLLSKADSIAYFKLVTQSGLKEIKLFASGESRLWKQIDYFEFLKQKKTGEHTEIIIKAVLPSTSCKDFKTNYLLDSGWKTSYTSVPGKKNSIITFNALSVGKFLVLKFKNDSFSHDSFILKLKSGENRLNNNFKFTDKIYEKIIPARFIKNDSLLIKMATLNKVHLDTLLHYSVFIQNKADTVSMPSSGCRIESFSGSFYDTTLIRIQAKKNITDKIKLPILSSLFNIEPNYQILKSKILLSLNYNDACHYPQKLGIYKIKSSSGFTYVGGVADTIRHEITTKSSTLGQFFVGLDTIAPVIKIISPKYGKTLKPSFVIKFHVNDTFSGIASEDDIQVMLDEQFVLPEWDPEIEIVVARPHWNVERGRHKISIMVKDAVGNITQKQQSIIIK